MNDPEMGASRTRAALYGRVSTLDQNPESQLHDLRRYAEHRGWTIVEELSTTASVARRIAAHPSTA